MSLLELFKRPGPSGFGYGSTAEDVTAGLDLAGRTILITGCNTGLGQEAMRVLAMRGARVIGTARTAEKARAAGSAMPLSCELSEPASVRACIAALRDVRLDAIICNAGIMALPKLERAHGYELQFFTNHIGHFILVTGLLAQTKRVVMVSSEGHRAATREGIQLDNLDGARGYSGFRAYGQSKLANILFAKELARRGHHANANHPGTIATKLTRNMTSIASVALAMVSPIALKSVAQGAATEVYAATHPSLAGVSGEYFIDSNIAKPTRRARDAELARALWDESERIVARL